MNERDKRLINTAWNVSCSRWYEINSLIEEAVSMEAKEKLTTIRNYKYHIEEYTNSLD